jgi:predicted esterase
VAATNYLNDLKGAIQLDQATDDQTVSIEYSRNLNMLLNATSVVHEFNEFPSGGHNISGVNFTEAMNKTVGFFDTYLKGK